MRKAPDALRIGLIQGVVEHGDLLQEARSLTDKVYKYSPTLIRAFLEMAQLAQQGDREVPRLRETQLFGDCWESGQFLSTLHKGKSQWKSDVSLYRGAADGGKWHRTITTLCLTWEGGE